MQPVYRINYEYPPRNLSESRIEDVRAGRHGANGHLSNKTNAIVLQDEAGKLRRKLHSVLRKKLAPQSDLGYSTNTPTVMETLAHNSTLRPGEMLNWYQIVRVLGRGGFGITYLAHDSNLRTNVAIKEYLPDFMAFRDHDNCVKPKTDSDTSTFKWGLSSFLDEARTLVKFKHRSIVRVLTVFEANDTAYMVMEFEHGQDLKALLARRDSLDEKYLKTLISPIIDGLREVHRHGFIHRDIKPDNIYIRDDNTPVLLDFGSARLALSNTTQNLTALVSSGYTPLEQYGNSSDQQQGPWTDIYAMSAVLYFTIVGKPPTDSTLRAAAILNSNPDPLHPISAIGRDSYSAEFLKGIEWGLGFRVSERPQSLDEWRDLLFADAQSLAKSSMRIKSSQKQAPLLPTITTDTVLRPPSQANTQVPQIVPFKKKVDDPLQASEALRDRQDQKRSPHNPKISQKQLLKGRDSAWLVLALALALIAIGLTGYWQWQQSAGGKRLVGPNTTESLLNAEPSQQPLSAELIRAPNQDIDTDVVSEAATQSEIAAKQASEAEAAKQAEIAAQQAREAEAAREAELAAEQAREAEAARQAEIAAQQAREAKAAREAELAAEQAREAEAAKQAEIAAQQAREAEAAREAELVAKQAREAEAARQAEIAAQQAREAEAAREAELVAKQAREAEAARQAEIAARPITDSEIQNAALRFNELMQTIRARDLQKLGSLTSPSNKYNALFGYWFESFEQIDVQLGGISANRLSQRVNALLTVSRLVRPNGDILLPAKAFRSIPIHTSRVNGEWSKIQWSSTDK